MKSNFSATWSCMYNRLRNPLLSLWWGISKTVIEVWGSTYIYFRRRKLQICEQLESGKPPTKSQIWGILIEKPVRLILGNYIFYRGKELEPVKGCNIRVARSVLNIMNVYVWMYVCMYVCMPTIYAGKLAEIGRKAENAQGVCVVLGCYRYARLRRSVLSLASLSLRWLYIAGHDNWLGL